MGPKRYKNSKVCFGAVRLHNKILIFIVLSILIKKIILNVDE